MNGRYKLNDKNEAVEVKDLMEWAKDFETSDRRVAKDTIDDVKVSTVFLGLDHNFGGDTPILFETMIFGGEHAEYQDRYATWDEAVAGHKTAVDRVKDA